jgi:hypothetical protein
MNLPPHPAGSRLEIVMFSGDRIEFGRYELARALVHRYVVIHYVLVCFFLALVNTRSGLPAIRMNEQVIIVFFSVFTAVIFLILLILVLDHIASRRGGLTVRASHLLLVMTVCGVLAGDATALMILEGAAQRWLRTGVLAVFYYILVEAVAHLMILVVIPRALLDLRSRKPQPDLQAMPTARKVTAQSDGPDHVEIGRRRLKLDSLVRITAEGNYLRVVTSEERIFLPGPFSAVVEELPERVGVQLSRSEWVATKIVRGIRRERREMFVDLQDGTSVRVANSRQKLVLSLLDLPVEDGRTKAADQGPGPVIGRDRSIQTG